jgi:hypothetical protein
VPLLEFIFSWCASLCQPGSCTACLHLARAKVPAGAEHRQCHCRPQCCRSSLLTCCADLQSTCGGIDSLASNRAAVHGNTMGSSGQEHTQSVLRLGCQISA